MRSRLDCVHDQRQPTVVVTGSCLTVQDQMPAQYAEGLAAHGFTAFTLDLSGFGKSDGALRQTEMPSRTIDEIPAADFVSTMSLVERGGGDHLAICASAQYAVAAIARGARIRSGASPTSTAGLRSISMISRSWSNRRSGAHFERTVKSQ